MAGPLSKKRAAVSNPNHSKAKGNDLEGFEVNCFHCCLKFDTVAEVYTHWKADHATDVSKEHVKPFAFKLVEQVMCFQCFKQNDKVKRDTLHKIGLHHFMEHKEQPFASIKSNSVRRRLRQCGECNSRFAKLNDLLEHYTLSHVHPELYSIKQDPNNLTDSCIDRFSGIVVQRAGRKSSRMWYCCSHNHCSKKLQNELDMAKHILVHNPQYQCKFCTRVYTTLKLVLEHQKLMHNKPDDGYKIVNLNNIPELGKPYRQMRLVLPNGYGFTKEEALNTRYGDMQAIYGHIRKLNEEELARTMTEIHPPKKLSKQTSSAPEVTWQDTGTPIQ